MKFIMAVAALVVPWLFVGLVLPEVLAAVPAEQRLAAVKLLLDAVWWETVLALLGGTFKVLLDRLRRSE